MKKIIYSVIVSLTLSLLNSCISGESKKSVIERKNECFKSKLDTIKMQDVYKDAMAAFVDTFKVWKSDSRYFGLPSVVTAQVDESIFFNSGKNKCLLLVLQKPKDTYIFGSVRVINGDLFNDKWIFFPNQTFELDYNTPHI